MVVPLHHARGRRGVVVSLVNNEHEHSPSLASASTCSFPLHPARPALQTMSGAGLGAFSVCSPPTVLDDIKDDVQRDGEVW